MYLKINKRNSIFTIIRNELVGLTGKMTKNMGEVNLFVLIKIGTKESSRMTLRVVQEHIIMSMVISFPGNGTITKRMVKEY